MDLVLEYVQHRGLYNIFAGEKAAICCHAGALDLNLVSVASGS